MFTVCLFLQQTSPTVFTAKAFAYLVFRFRLLLMLQVGKQSNLWKIVKLLWIMMTQTIGFLITFRLSDPHKKYIRNVLVTLKMAWLFKPICIRWNMISVFLGLASCVVFFIGYINDLWQCCRNNEIVLSSS